MKTGDRPHIWVDVSDVESFLVMDDDDAIRCLLGAVLGTFGYEVHTVRHGAEAIAVYEQAKLSRKPFDAALLDLTVTGGMGGVETACLSC